MTVYVDDFRIQARVGRLNARWSHLTCGPFDDLEELHAFAAKIGLQHRWFQDKPWPRAHYDVTESKRQEAIRAGATPITWREAGKQMVDARDRAKCQCGAGMPANEHGRMVHPEPWCAFMVSGSEISA